MKQPSVAVVILNWDGIADTRDCLESIFTQSYKNYTIILVDNGSKESGTKKFLSEVKQIYTEKLIVIENTTNLGFAGGVNTGITYALENEYSHVALFNNDAVADKNWLSELVKASVDNNSAITTGLLLNESGKQIDSSGDWYSTWGLPFPRSRDNNTDDAPSSGEVFGASGGASLYKTSLFNRIGLFDEKFFAYYEDVDISFRAQLSGNKVYYTDKAIAYHKRGASSDKISGFAVKQTMKNLPMLYVKNVPTSLLIPIGVRFFTSYNLIFIKALFKASPLSALKGYILSILYIPYCLQLRWVIQRQKTISSEQIYSKLWHDLPPNQSGIRNLLSKFSKR